MPTDLATHIDNFIVVDTHEHMVGEAGWITRPPDVLSDLFDNYMPADLIAAGASLAAVQRLCTPGDPDVEGRWAGVAAAWDAARFTGYGEAVSLIARSVYGIEEISAASARAAEPKLRAMLAPGQRLHLLRDVAKLDHMQIDAKQSVVVPDESGADFFLHDLSWWDFTSGRIDAAAVEAQTRITVRNLATLRQAMEGLFERSGPCAIAVKSQHAYDRTLRWTRRSDADAERALQGVLANTVDECARLCLGDWCLDRGAELAQQHHLPFKIHTGYLAFNGPMSTDDIRPGNLCPLLEKHPQTRFVLMHTGYPYGEELIAIVKHFPNAWADLCWAWAIDPYSTTVFVRRFIHAAPINKMFGFGGDTWRPAAAIAYSLQMRNWLNRALRQEVDAGDLRESQAIEMATRLLRDNQLACFDIAGTRDAIRKLSRQ